MALFMKQELPRFVRPVRPLSAVDDDYKGRTLSLPAKDDHRPSPAFNTHLSAAKEVHVELAAGFRLQMSQLFRPSEILVAQL